MDPRYPISSAELVRIPVPAGGSGGVYPITITKEIQVFDAVSFYMFAATFTTGALAANRRIVLQLRDSDNNLFRVSHTNPITASLTARLSWYPKFETEIFWTDAILSQQSHTLPMPFVPIENPKDFQIQIMNQQDDEVMSLPVMAILGWRQKRPVGQGMFNQLTQ